MAKTQPAQPQPPMAQELTVITKAYDLMREMTHRVAKLPRDYRFVLGDRILENVYELFDMLIEVKCGRDKLPLLDSEQRESRPVPGRKAECRSGVGLTEDTVQDANYWITELASSVGVLESWPGKATPADLERLGAAPAEAWTGKLGAARRVLRTIMAHRITTGTFEPMVVEADEFAGEFVVATD